MKKSTLKVKLEQYYSVCGKLRTADLEQENDHLCSRLFTYENVISHNNLWLFLAETVAKSHNRDDACWCSCRMGKNANFQMGALKSYRTSFGRAPFKNQTTFTGDELRKIREKQEVL